MFYNNSAVQSIDIALRLYLFQHKIGGNAESKHYMVNVET